VVRVNEFLLINSRRSDFPELAALGVGKKKRTAILLKTQLIKEDNDAIENRSDS
jgi:hypothetical protein